MDLNELFSRIWQFIHSVIGPLGSFAAISLLCLIFGCIICQSGDNTFRNLLINPLPTHEIIVDTSRFASLSHLCLISKLTTFAVRLI